MTSFSDAEHSHLQPYGHHFAMTPQVGTPIRRVLVWTGLMAQLWVGVPLIFQTWPAGTPHVSVAVGACIVAAVSLAVAISAFKGLPGRTRLDRLGLRVSVAAACVAVMAWMAVALLFKGFFDSLNLAR